MQNLTIDLLSPNDHAWVLSRALGIFMMQGGFALLEAGCVRSSNRANIMMKNVADSASAGGELRTIWPSPHAADAHPQLRSLALM